MIPKVSQIHIVMAEMKNRTESLCALSKKPNGKKEITSIFTSFYFFVDNFGSSLVDWFYFSIWIVNYLWSRIFHSSCKCN